MTRPIKPDYEPNFSLYCKNNIKVDFWIVKLINENNAKMLYKYHNDHWKEHECSYTNVRDGKAYFSIESPDYDTRWSRHGDSEDKKDTQLHEQDLMKALKEYMTTIDKILVGEEETDSIFL
jgi:hypothetical protein